MGQSNLGVVFIDSFGQKLVISFIEKKEFPFWNLPIRYPGFSQASSFLEGNWTKHFKVDSLYSSINGWKVL